MLTSVVRDSFSSRTLSGVITRWVRSSRKGYVTTRRIETFEYSRDERLRVVDTAGQTVFSGTLERLFAQWFEGLEAVGSRLRAGKPLGPVSYPSIALPLTYLVDAARDHAKNTAQNEFWHAAGSESQYYVNHPEFQRKVTELGGDLVRLGDLPQSAVLHMIPTLPCQLFATCDSGRHILEELLDEWRRLYGADARLVDCGAALARSHDPASVVGEVFGGVPARVRRRVVGAVHAFNEEDVNHLPVGHVPQLPSPSYNKFGMSQERVYECSMFFPNNLWDMRWIDAELLVKILAHAMAEDWR